MDFTFTEEQQAAAEAARAVFADVAPDGVPSPALTPGAVAEDIDRQLWNELARTDLLGLTLSPDHGGAGLDPIALCLVLRESAKVLARVPLLESCAVAMAVQRYAGSALAAELLPPVGRGERILTVGANGRTGHDPAELAVTARRYGEIAGSGESGGASAGGSGWVLDGVQSAVPWARAADWIAVPAHNGGGRPVLALVPRTRDGLTLADQVSTSGERLAEVRLDGVRVTDRELIDAPGCWEWLRSLLTTGTCALALGLGERVLAMTAAYTGGREQFGFPVATFQAVAVQAADRYIDLRAMEATLWQAAWRISADAGGPLPAAGDVAVAKIWASDGVRRVVQTAQHLHGGFGADTDYPLHRFHAWAKQIELSLGPAAAHEEALGDLLAAHPLG
ncbi:MULTISPECIES: acyl-CoA dehydrogenase family protein [Streptomyces]|uniref:Acyl-CoA dehydrogenase n=1 Tax=Streptomyces griseus subsp. griseus (strain JCM 4626 / CBS 651.72 / NBRC 13350 / KCC S-0626 / ISP 5235) TaxID=455632 RepID=B1VQR4_STRGG|nr:acyl-CoA dehydrogenase family protein [Streptomyces griseus]BAG20565.1 putative acyl-CoA dehydrogenase [Streptomyces griseus subsp. griseus NBRC 13350]SEE77834.1 Acyl-CoA dehydrogenase, N-terminal domain [Streptomyces griseus]SQA23377.1 acyl-CoA dehydrogenase [Streptomyces griseus]